MQDLNNVSVPQKPHVCGIEKHSKEGESKQCELRDTTDTPNDVTFCERVLNIADADDVSKGDVIYSDNGFPDGGWGWVVVMASLMFNIIYDGCSYSFGILYIEFLDQFQESKGNTAWIGSLYFAVPLLCGPISAKLSQKIGARMSTMIGGFIALLGFLIGSFASSVWMLVLCYGLISGFGMSIPYFNSTVVIAKYFHKRRACATGIAESGAGLGTLIFAPIVQLLVNVYRWRGALLVLSGVVGNVVVCGALYRPVPQRKRHQQSHKTGDSGVQQALLDGATTGIVGSDRSEDNLEESKETSSVRKANVDKRRMNVNKVLIKKYFVNKFQWCSTHCTSPFTIFMASNFIMYFWYDVPYVFLVDYPRGLNIRTEDAALLLSIIGGVHTVGILLYGYLGDIERLNTSLLFSVSIASCGVSLALVPITAHYAGLATLAALFGLTSAATEALVPVVLIQLVGLESFDTAFGLTMFLEGIANLTGPPFAGLLADVTGQYNVTFYAAGVSVAIIGSLYALLPVIQKIGPKDHHSQTIELRVQSLKVSNVDIDGSDIQHSVPEID